MHDRRVKGRVDIGVVEPVDAESTCGALNEGGKLLFGVAMR